MQINNSSHLKETIYALEIKKQEQEKALLSQFHAAYESLSPVNLLKNTFSKIASEPDIIKTIIRTATGFGIGMLTKKIFTGGSSSMIKKFLGNAVGVGVTKTAINQGDKIKAYSMAIYNNLFKKKTARKEIQE